MAYCENTNDFPDLTRTDAFNGCQVQYFKPRRIQQGLRVVRDTISTKKEDGHVGYIKSIVSKYIVKVCWENDTQTEEAVGNQTNRSVSKKDSAGDFIGFVLAVPLHGDGSVNGTITKCLEGSGLVKIRWNDGLTTKEPIGPKGIMIMRAWRLRRNQREHLLGTITGISEDSKTVTVQWDDAIETLENIGHDGLFSLRLFDNAQIGVVHDHVSCGACNKNPIRGFRWKCATCKDFDLCTKCYMNDEHHGHVFRLMQEPLPLSVACGKRQKGIREQNKYTLQRIVKGSKVSIEQEKVPSSRTNCFSLLPPLKKDTKTGVLEEFDDRLELHISVKDIRDGKIMEVPFSELLIQSAISRSSEVYQKCKMCQKLLKENAIHTTIICSSCFDDLAQNRTSLPENEKELLSRANEALKGTRVILQSKHAVMYEIDEILKYKLRRRMKVKWKDDNTVETLDIDGNSNIGLRGHKGKMMKYYPGHLPVLGKHLKCSMQVEDASKQMKAHVVWIHETQENDSKHLKLHVVIENLSSDLTEESREKYLREAFELSKNSGVTCHLVSEQVAFSGDVGKAFVAPTTNKETIEFLINNGYKEFITGRLGTCANGHTETDLRNVQYFIDLIGSELGFNLIPLVLKIGGTNENMEAYYKQHCLPLIYMNENGTLALVKTWRKMIQSEEVFTHEYFADTKLPWKECANATNTWNLNYISDMQFHRQKDQIFLYLLLGALLSKREDKKKITEGEKGISRNETSRIQQISAVLLRKGAWFLPRKDIKGAFPFDFRVVNYIREEETDKSDFFAHLADITNDASVPPSHLSPNKRHGYTAVQENRTEKVDKELREENLSGAFFHALLELKLLTGAKQMITTGYARTSHILIGNAILEHLYKDPNTTREEDAHFLKLKSEFTQQAICITRQMYGHEKAGDSEGKKQVEKLLINHQTLKLAIKTKNSEYLHDPVIQKILKRKWYGETRRTDESAILKYAKFLLFVLGHLVLIPLVILNVKSKLLESAVEKYSVPFMKVFIHVVSIVYATILFSYMLLFDFSAEMTPCDYLIIYWMFNFALEEVKQILISREMYDKHVGVKEYLSDPWNKLDLLILLSYTIGMLLRIGSNPDLFDGSKILIVITFGILCLRNLHFFSISEFLGPKLVMIKNMFKDTAAFMTIMFVIMFCFSVSSYSLLYPNSDFSFSQIEAVLHIGYWVIFGENGLDDIHIRDADCDEDPSETAFGFDKRCPVTLGITVVPYLKAAYALVAVVLLLNLLITIFSDTYNRVAETSRLYWAQMQVEFLEEFCIKSVIPVHFQVWSLAVGLVFSFLRKVLALCNVQFAAELKRAVLYNDDFYCIDEKTFEFEYKAILEVASMYGITDKNEGEDTEVAEIKEKVENIETHLHTIESQLKEILKHNGIHWSSKQTTDKGHFCENFSFISAFFIF